MRDIASQAFEAVGVDVFSVGSTTGMTRLDMVVSIRCRQLFVRWNAAVALGVEDELGFDEDAMA